MSCAWCGQATGELVVPGKRGAVVHPLCERARAGRRSFLFGAVVLAGAAAAAPLLDLVPEAPALTPALLRSAINQTVTFDFGKWIWLMHPAQYEAVREFAPEAIDANGHVLLDVLIPPDRRWLE